MTDGCWFPSDEIGPDPIFRLAKYRRMSTEFGYLLRHYWMPATKLTWSIQIRQTVPDLPVLEVEKWTEHRMVKCDADQCVWREKTLKKGFNSEFLMSFSRPRTTEYICTYDRSQQTFQCQNIKRFIPFPEKEYDARNEAFMQQPILTPLMPIPVGFTWHVRNDEGYMEFTLESAKDIDGMTVLFIRRKGKMLFDKLYTSKMPERFPYHVIREGSTTYALERSLVLEDRTYDCLKSLGNHRFAEGLETWTTTQLILSELTE